MVMFPTLTLSEIAPPKTEPPMPPLPPLPNPNPMPPLTAATASVRTCAAATALAIRGAPVPTADDVVFVSVSAALAATAAGPASAAQRLICRELAGAHGQGKQQVSQATALSGTTVATP